MDHDRKEQIEHAILNESMLSEHEALVVHKMFAKRSDTEIVEVVRIGLAQLAGRSVTDMDRSNLDRVYPSEEVFKESLRSIIYAFTRSLEE